MPASICFNAAKEVFGDKVKIIIDRFHVAKLYRKGVDTLRKAEMKRLKNTLVKEEYAQLKNVMWILRKDTKNLLDEELEVLQLLFMHSPLLETSYKLSKELTYISPFAQSISNTLNFKLSIERSTQSQTLQDGLLHP